MATLRHSTESLPKRWALVPVSSYGFLDSQLLKLQAIDRRLTRITQCLSQQIETCRAGQRGVDMFSAVVLVRLWQDVLRLEAQTHRLVRHSRRRLAQASTGCRRLQEVNHG